MSAETETKTKRTRVLLADDHPIVMEGVLGLISSQPDLEVCGSATTRDEAYSIINECDPAIIIADLSFDNFDGVAFIKELRERFPDKQILVFSMRDEKIYAERALKAGACGFVPKNGHPDMLVQAIRDVLGGRLFITDDVQQHILQKMVRSNTNQERSLLDGLSNRELEIFTLIGQGLHPRDIAKRTGISQRTVETHRENIKNKLNFRSTTELFHYAVSLAQSDDL